MKEWTRQSVRNASPGSSGMDTSRTFTPISITNTSMILRRTNPSKGKGRPTVILEIREKIVLSILLFRMESKLEFCILCFRFKSYSESTYFTQTSERTRDQQVLRLNFNYRFGKFDATLFKRKNTKADQSGGQDMMGGQQ